MGINDSYYGIVDSFMKNLTCKDEIRSIVLDGSLNNNEHIENFSDIDLKIFIKGTLIRQGFFDAVNNAIAVSLDNHRIIFNVWLLLEDEYPSHCKTSSFDFVRRYCLLKGRVLYSDGFLLANELQSQIGMREKLDCLKALFNFQIRLRRLLTNPSAISDVPNVSCEFILQQGIAYLFHALRYYYAFNGHVCCTISKLANISKELNCIPNKNNEEFIDKLYYIRYNWNIIGQSYFSSALDILYETTALIDELSGLMKNKIDDTSVKLNYL